MNQAFELIGLPPLIKLDNGIGGGPEYDGILDMFAKTFGLEVLTNPCDMRVFEGSYDWARRVMEPRTRNREPVAVMDGSAIPVMLLSEDMWECTERRSLFAPRPAQAKKNARRQWTRGVPSPRTDRRGRHALRGADTAGADR